MAWTKFIVVVDDDVNVHDEEAVLRAMFEHCDFARDTEVVNGPLDILDHAAPRLGAGCKMGFDATRKISGEEVNGVQIDQTHRTATPTPPDCDPWASQHGVFIPEFAMNRCAFVAVDKRQAQDGASAIQRAWSDAPPGTADFIIAVDQSVNVKDWQSVFFHMCANCDPGRDLHRCEHRIAFDATKKIIGDERNGQPVRDYPPILVMSDDVKQAVDNRRAEFGM
jgi:3-polyprenyl-4-hydroxybenzoate decarboxylase